MPTLEAAAAELSNLVNEKGERMASFNHSLLQYRLGLAFSTATEFTILPELTLELPTVSV